MSAQAGCIGTAHFLTSALNVACTTFRDDGTPSYFYRWPERQSHTLCCGRGDLLTNYSYPGRPCEPLVTGIYYDVRLVARLNWYFLHWDFSFLDKTQPQATTMCEYSILHEFYKRWFQTNVFFHGVLFGFALILFTQGIIWCVWRFWLKRPLAMWSDDYDAALIACFHMGLLGVNGFAAMVAAGHGALLSFASDSFSCAMSLYSYLTLLSMLCMAFEHLAYEEDCLIGERLHAALLRGLKRSDWRWQPVWAQVAAGICMYMYSTGVETSPGQLDQGAGQAIPVVVLAIFWSGGHTMVYVVQVVEIVIIELLRAAGVIAKLRSIGVLKPSKASTSAIPTANLTQIATTSTATNPNPNPSGTTSAASNPAPTSATTTATIPNPTSTTTSASPTPSPVTTPAASTTP
jgi:hypothetical protein